jgi:hypothetical protein
MESLNNETAISIQQLQEKDRDLSIAKKWMIPWQLCSHELSPSNMNETHIAYKEYDSVRQHFGDENQDGA